MGSGVSRSTNFNYSNPEIFRQGNESFFETASDEKAFSTEFFSELFTRSESEIVQEYLFPDESTIFDIVYDPSLLTQTDSSGKAWQDIIMPLFFGSESTKPYFQQIMLEYFAFLRQRPNKVIQEIESKRQATETRRNEEIRQINNIHDNIRNAPPLDLTRLKSVVTDPGVFISSIPKITTSFYYHTDFLRVSDALMSTSESVLSRFASIRWGFYSADMASILYGLVGLSRIIIKNPKIQTQMDYGGLDQLIPYFPLTNTLSPPIASSLKGSSVVPNLKIQGSNSSSCLCSDGKFIYILGSKGKIHIVSLSEGILRTENRFRQIDMLIPKTEKMGLFITSSNGFLFLSGPFVHKDRVFRMHPFGECETTFSYSNSGFLNLGPKITAPVTSDGQNIYSLTKPKKVSVFSILPSSIVYHRTIDLKHGSNKLQSPFENKLVPQIWINQAMITTNGTSLSFIVLIRSESSRFDYFMRSFSLVDGAHINDLIFVLKYPIHSLAIDPWNNCQWIVSPSLECVSLLKNTYNGARPPWVIGMQLNTIPSIDDISKSFYSTKYPKAIVASVSNFISYFSPHFAGCSFFGSTTNPSYNVTMAHLFGQCSERMMIQVTQSLSFFYQLDTKHISVLGLTEGDFGNLMHSLLIILQICASNIQSRNLSSNISSNTIECAIDTLFSIFKNPHFNYLRRSIIYVFSSAFTFFFQKHNNQCSAVFRLIYSENDDYVVFHSMCLIQNTDFFAYCFSQDTCRKIIIPLLDLMISSPHEMKQSQIELLHLFQKNLMLEIGRIYMNMQGSSLDSYHTELQYTFLLYSNSISSRMIELLSKFKDKNDEHFRLSLFVKLFRKWVMMLQPLSQFSSISSFMISNLSNLFDKFAQAFSPIDSNHFLREGKKSIVFEYSLFIEVLVVFTDFICAILDGGSELKDILKYSWLVRSKNDTKITFDSLNDAFKNIFEVFNVDFTRGFIKNGTSKKESIDLLVSLITPIEDEDSSLIMNYLYKSVTNNQNKNIKQEQREIERLLFASFIKQMDQTEIVLNLIVDLKGDKNVALPSIVVSITQSIYRIRNSLRQAKQRAAYHESLEDDSSKNPASRTLSENYADFSDTIRRKCLYLLHISPCSIHSSQSSTKDHIYHLQYFLLGEMRLKDCFDLIDSAEELRKKVSTCFALINHILNSNLNEDFISILIDRITISGRIMQYLSSMRFDDRVKGNTGVINVMGIINTIGSKFQKTKSLSFMKSLILFYSNLLLTTGKFDCDFVIGPFSMMYKAIQENSLIHESGNKGLYILLLSSCIYSVMKETSSPPSQESIQTLTKQIQENNPEIKGIVSLLGMACGFPLEFNPRSYIEMIIDTPPETYSRVFNILYEIINHDLFTNELVYWILREISSIAAGTEPNLLIKRSYINNTKVHVDQNVKTPGAQLSACLSLVQIIRKLLLSQSKASLFIKDVISSVLRFNIDQNFVCDSTFKMFCSRDLLFAVFVILSNSIELIRTNSLVKNIINNDIYYVTGINEWKNEFTSRRVPIGPNSSIITHFHSPSFVPLSTIPFTPSLFPEYNLVLPYFFEALSSQCQFNEALSYYILSSLSEYIGATGFLQMLFAKEAKFDLSPFSVQTHNEGFLRILRHHLSAPGFGFLASPIAFPRMMYCSHSIIIPHELYSLSEDQITTTKGVHVFVSSILSNENPTYLRLNNKKLPYEAGIQCFSLSTSNISSYLVSSISNSVYYNGNEIETLSPSNLYDLTICFNPKKKKVKFLTTENGSKIFSASLPSSNACFILHLFGKTSLSYSIGFMPPHCIPVNESTAKDLCPFHGKVVLRQKKPIDSKSSIVYGFSNFSNSNSYQQPIKRGYQPFHDYQHKFMFCYEKSIVPIITYPHSLLHSIGETLDLSILDTLKSPNPSYSFFSISQVSSFPTPSPMTVSKMLNHNGKALVFSLPENCEPLYIEDLTGKVQSVDSYQLTDRFDILPIHPNYYGHLPTEILNFFASGIVSEYRLYSLNQIFIRSIVTQQIGIESALNVFSCELPQLLEFALSLILMVEPISFSSCKDDCPLDFAVNILSENYTPKSSTHIFKSAIDSIFSYFSKSSLNEIISEFWMNLLWQQFSNNEAHFISNQHQEAIIIPIKSLNNPRTISNINAIGFICYPTGFGPSSGSYAQITYGDSSCMVTEGISYIKSSSFTIQRLITDNGISIITIPLYSGTNSTLSHTFFEFILSYKYFILFISGLDTTSVETKNSLYQILIDSFLAYSPFFISYGSLLFDFLMNTIPISGIDLSPTLISKFMVLGYYASTSKYPVIQLFLKEQQTSWEERILIPLKTFFPEFMIQNEKLATRKYSIEEIVLPSPFLPPSAKQSEDLSAVANQILRLMKPRSGLTGFPFHLILNEWILYVSKYPPFILTQEQDSIFKIQINLPQIEPFTLVFDTDVIDTIQISQTISGSFDLYHSEKITMKEFFIKALFRGQVVSDPSDILLILISNPVKNPKEFLISNRDLFVNDMRTLFLNWDKRIDDMIVSTFPENHLSSDTIVSEAKPYPKWKSNTQLPIHVLCVRYSLLYFTSWMLFFDKFNVTDSSIRYLCKSMPMGLITQRFHALINEQSNDDIFDISINRKAAVDVREGVSQNLNSTIISQIAKLYRNPRDFRRRGDRPWKVVFNGEQGVDAGGPARELVGECVLDMISKNCGLFIPTPNSRNDIAGFRDTIIPIPSSKQTNIEMQYKICGVLIGICIRSGNVQDFYFPPLIWEYLVTGVITIERIFEIDQTLMDTINSLSQAVSSEIDEETFQSRFCFNFVIQNSIGEEVALKQRGRKEKVTLQNCREFINLAKEYRLGEMKPYLEAMREGLWENLNFKPPSYITAELLEFNASGSKEISSEQLKKAISFDNVPKNHKDQFLRVVDALTAEQRSQLLRFTTGRVKFPINYDPNEIFIKVDFSNSQTDKLPTASTCFNQFHLPNYSSFTVAKLMISKAIEYTGTFENR